MVHIFRGFQDFSYFLGTKKWKTRLEREVLITLVNSNQSKGHNSEIRNSRNSLSRVRPQREQDQSSRGAGFWDMSSAGSIRFNSALVTRVNTAGAFSAI